MRQQIVDWKKRAQVEEGARHLPVLEGSGIQPEPERHRVTDQTAGQQPTQDLVEREKASSEEPTKRREAAGPP